MKDRKVEEKNFSGIEHPGRRRLLAAMGISGTVAVDKILPDSWVRPIFDSILIPAHAACTVPQLDGLISIDVDFDSNSCVEFAIEVSTPCGGRLRVGQPTTTLIHDGTGTGTIEPDHVTNIGGMVSQGTYRVYVRLISGPCGTASFQDDDIQVRVRTNNQSAGTVLDLSDSGLNSQFGTVGSIQQVASIVFPPGSF